MIAHDHIFEYGSSMVGGLDTLRPLGSSAIHLVVGDEDTRSAGATAVTRSSATHMASLWGLPAAAVSDSLHGRASAVRWAHDFEEIDQPGVDETTVVLMLTSARSYLLRGGRRMEANAHRGGLNLRPKGLDGRWQFESPIECLHLYLPEALCQSLAEQENLPNPPELDLRLKLHDPLIGVLMEEIHAEMLRGGCSGLYLDTMSTAIYLRLVRAHSSCAPTSNLGPAKGGLAPWQVKRVCSYLEDHLADDVSLADLGELLNLSTFHLCRAFKRSTGLPPHRWRSARRLERARELLERTTMPMSDVAAAVGYEEPRQLATMFRKAYGISPSQYRRERASSPRKG